MNWIRLLVPQKSSFEATGVRLSTDGPVYAARTVSKPAVQVSKRIFLLEVGVNLYQTDLNGPAPACGGSPVWVVAYVLSPDRVPLAAWSSVRTSAFAKSSFGGGGGSDGF